MNIVKSEDPVEYGTKDTTAADNDVIAKAIGILHTRLVKYSVTLDDPVDVQKYLVLRLAEKKHEVFGVLWFNSRSQLIADEELFRGTISQTSVYPREVLRAALAANARCCVIYHNHPSGSPAPSEQDRKLTRQVKEALDMVEVQLRDHIVVGGGIPTHSIKTVLCRIK